MALTRPRTACESTDKLTNGFALFLSWNCGAISIFVLRHDLGSVQFLFLQLACAVARCTSFCFDLVWFANCMRSQKLVRSISFRAVPYVRFGLCCYCELIYNYYSILRVCFISSFHFGSKSMGTFSKTGSFFMPTTRAVIYTCVIFFLYFTHSLRLCMDFSIRFFNSNCLLTSSTYNSCV